MAGHLLGWEELRLWLGTEACIECQAFGFLSGWHSGFSHSRLTQWSEPFHAPSGCSLLALWAPVPREGSPPTPVCGCLRRGRFLPPVDNASLIDSVQFSSSVVSDFCDPMKHLPVHHQLPEVTQTHVHRVRDAIQPSHPRSSPSPPAPNPSQHQSLFQ